MSAPPPRPPRGDPPQEGHPPDGLYVPMLPIMYPIRLAPRFPGQNDYIQWCRQPFDHHRQGAINQNRPRNPGPVAVNNRQAIIQNQPRNPGPVAVNNRQAIIQNRPRNPGLVAVNNRQGAKLHQQSIDLMFNKYAETSHRIGAEGIASLCDDLEIDYTDVKILLLAWKMKAAEQGTFTRDEWQRGLGAIQADSITKLKSQLTVLENMANDTADFRDFYIFAFKFHLEDDHKTLNIGIANKLLNIILGARYPDRVEKFTEFLTIKDENTRLTMDNWQGFLHFCRQIEFPSLDNYNMTDSWPLILDDFVEWMRLIADPGSVSQ